jgi:O-antigen/teichoic acid export membrane protein
VKIISVFLGVAGMGILSQLLNFQTFMIFIVTIGIPLGLTKYISEHKQDDTEIVNIIFLNSLKILTISSLIFALLISIFSGYISGIIFDDSNYYYFIILLALSIPFSTFSGFLEAYLRGLRNIDLLIKLLISSAIVGFVFTLIMVLLFHLEGAVIGSLFNALLSCIIYFFVMKKQSLIPKLKIFIKFNKEIINNIIKIGFASLIVGSVAQLVLLLIRTITINKMGVFGNGIYQSVLTISVNYFGFIFISLNTYSFPKVSSLKLNSEIVDEINLNFRYIMFLMIPLIAFIFVFREVVIALLFTKDFSSSEPLYKYQFFGDLFKAFSWVLGLWLIPRLKLFLWVTLDMILSANFLLIYILLLNFYENSLISLAIAYLMSNLIHLVLNLIATKKYLNFKFQSKNLSAAILGIILLLILVCISEYKIVYGYISIIPALFLWFSYAVKKNEWIFVKDNFRKYIYNRFVT